MARTKNKITASSTGGTIDGTSSGDQIEGSNAGDTVESGSGRDKVISENGNDHIIGGANRDNLVGNDGNDHIEGRASNDTLSGRNGNDYLEGGGQDDKLYGGEGSDYLQGGDGDDRLYGTERSNGDAAVDYFAFDSDDGHDLVMNFEVGVDKIFLEDGASASLSYDAASGNTTMTYGATTAVFKGVDLTAADQTYLFATEAEIHSYGSANFGDPDFYM